MRSGPSAGVVDRSDGDADGRTVDRLLPETDERPSPRPVARPDAPVRPIAAVGRHRRSSPSEVLMRNTDRIRQFVAAHRADHVALSDRVWECPELAYGEYRSVDAHVARLEADGFTLTRDVAGIPTAVIGEAGSGGPVIAILGEYDALPCLSQEAGVAERRELVAGGNGHGCGHNLLGAGALLAAVALKDWLAATGTPGRVRYYGCPAEEGGAAKAFMVRAGAFADVDIALTWHPGSMSRVDENSSLANMRIDFAFTGRASHAAAAPHLGRSALDAVELMNVGVNYLREHVPPDARIHYAVLDAGGVAPNVVQARAKVRYLIRSRDLPGLFALIERVKDCARGSALMTGTTVEATVVSAVADKLLNRPLDEAMAAVMRRLGPVPFDDADRAFAREIQKTLTAEDIQTDFRRIGMKVRRDTPLCDFPVQAELPPQPMIGSTDVADVSWVVPTVEARAATHAIGTPGHSWQQVAQGKAPAAHKGMVWAAEVMAATAVEAFLDPSLIARAKAALAEQTAETPYVSPLPPELKPSLQPRPADL
jgi:aminobenzoyl-glutamate utilization protein B